MTGRHTIQYAFVGRAYVPHTEKLTDDEVRGRVTFSPSQGPIERFDRCPECEAWTTTLGKLRTDIDCPAVKSALAAIRALE